MTEEVAPDPSCHILKARMQPRQTFLSEVTCKEFLPARVSSVHPLNIFRKVNFFLNDAVNNAIFPL